ncbi:MAG TPA: hypothetical protein VGM10_20750 [Actinocrinis sp.]
MAGRVSTRRSRGLIAVLAVATVLATAAACTSAGAGARQSPPAGMSGMTGMEGMSGMPMVPTAPTTPALAAAAPDGTGLSSSLSGYTLVPSTSTAIADSASTYSFHITGPDGKALMEYQPYESELVLCYVIRSDLTQYNYVQPAMRQDGTWNAVVPALPSGKYRAFVTFAAPDSSQGTPLLYQLSAPFTVPGPSSAAALPAPASTTTIDGYTVSLKGSPKAHTSAPLTLTIAKNGKPITSFERYLDGYAHLTAFHSGDMAFAQIFSLGAIQAHTGALTAEATFPESGSWRVFAQFELDNTVHTAQFTVNVPAGS